MYYDPAQPEDAVLEPANRQGSWAPLVAAGIFAAGGALMLTIFVSISNGFGH